MSICTKTGDKGKTSLYTGQRVAKSSLRVNSYGSVDEINSALAMAKATVKDEKIRKIVDTIQKMNMSLMSDLASIGAKPLITAEHVGQLESWINEFEPKLPPLTAFIQPGNTICGAFFDMARTTTRRAERNVLQLADSEDVEEQDRLFLNRLSDLCFLLMRTVGA